MKGAFVATGYSLRPQNRVRLAAFSCPRHPSPEWTFAGTTDELLDNGGKAVIQVQDSPVLLKEFAGSVYAVLNRCPHLDLPFESKILKAKYTDDGNIICGAHKSVFGLRNGMAYGVWCPAMAEVPFLGKIRKRTSLRTFIVDIDASGNIFVKDRPADKVEDVPQEEDEDVYRKAGEQQDDEEDV